MEDSSTQNFSNAKRAEVLTQALPFIRKHTGKIIVVKYGGNAMIEDQLKQQVMEDIVLLWTIGIKVVLLHGGGPEINDVMQQMGKEPEFINGLRVTDKETVDIVQMVLAGKVNKTLVAMLESYGGNAMGISGIDGRLIEAETKDEKLGFVGKVTHINAEPIFDLLNSGYIPVISTVGCDKSGNIYNINGDTAAAHIAGALGAKRLILMTDIAGILTNKNDRNTLIPELSISEAKKLADNGIINGGMLPKVECCIKALNEGVDKVVIMDGRIPHSILMELLTDEGAGTMMVKDEAGKQSRID
jgi:acetylglutamate kinase